MLSGRLILAIFITCFGSSMLYGYNMSVVNLPVDYIKCFLTRTKGEQENDPQCTEFVTAANSSQNTTNSDNDVRAEALYASFASIFVVSGTIGAFASGLIADLVGRKMGLLLNHIPVIIGGVLILPAIKIHNIALLFVARFFIGLNCGVSIAMASMYLTEISPNRWRGAIGACHQLAVTLGIVIGNILTMDVTMKRAGLWPIASMLTIVPAVISAVILPFLPESPRYLYIKKGDKEKAQKAYETFSPQGEVQEFIDEMDKEIETANSQPKFRFLSLFTDKSLRRPLLIAVTIQIMQQLSGINAVMTYSSTMLATANVKKSLLDVCVLLIGMLNVLCTVVSLPLLEKLGRRTILLYPTILIIGSLLILPISVNIAQQSSSESVKVGLGYFSVLLILIYIVGFAFGLGPIPGLIVSEIFTQGPRGAAYSVSQAVQWLSNLCVQLTYPIVDKKIGGYTFIPFLVVVVFFFVLFYFIMPETKGKSFEDISRELQGGKPAEMVSVTAATTAEPEVKVEIAEPAVAPTEKADAANV